MRSPVRWAIIAIVLLAGGAFAFSGLDWTGWVQSWIGSLFKAVSGGAIGWAVSRHICRLDLSQIEESKRMTAGLSQSILIAGFAVAVAVGV